MSLPNLSPLITGSVSTINQFGPYGHYTSTCNDRVLGLCTIPGPRMGPNPNNPAYIIGKEILRPAIDTGLSISKTVWGTVTWLFGHIDGSLTKIFALFPVAKASTTECSTFSNDKATCKLPTGPYEQSCHAASLTTISEKSCRLETYCKTDIPAHFPVKNSLTFAARRTLSLKNLNGSLVVLENTRFSFRNLYFELYLFLKNMDDLNLALSEKSNFHSDEIECPSCLIEEISLLKKKMYKQANEILEGIKIALERLAMLNLDGKNITNSESLKKNLMNIEPEILFRLIAGDVITTVDTKLRLINTIPKKQSCLLFNELEKITLSTGGIMGICSNFSELPSLINKIIEYTIEKAQHDQSVNIALIFAGNNDQLKKNIDSVKGSLDRFLKEAIDTGKNDGKSVQFALMAYHDKYNYELVDFTSHVQRLSERLDQIDFSDQKDNPNAIFDVISTGKNLLRWDEKASCSIILIGTNDPNATSTHYIDQDNPVSVSFYPILIGGKITV